MLEDGKWQWGSGGGEGGAAEKFLKFSVLDSWNKSHFLWSPCRGEDWLSGAAARPPPSHVPSPPASLLLSRGIGASAWENQLLGIQPWEKWGACLTFLPDPDPGHSASNHWSKLRRFTRSVSQLFGRRTGKKNNPGSEEVNPESFDSSVCRAWRGLGAEGWRGW